jgi:hypothetical protein
VSLLPEELTERCAMAARLSSGGGLPISTTSGDSKGLSGNI